MSSALAAAAPQWGGARFRDDAVTRLLAYGTLAGTYVEAARPNALPDAMLPALIVYAPLETRTLLSQVGSAPYYEAKLTLHIRGEVIGDTRDLARQAGDALISQVLDCLLSDPAWVKQFTEIPQADIKTDYPDDTDRHLVSFDIVFAVTYRDRYPPRETQRFLGADVAAVPSTLTPEQPPVPAFTLNP